MPEMNSAQRDAAEFMAPLMDYDVPMGELPGRLHLPGELRRRITGYGVDWPTSVTDEDLSTLDFTWMAELGTYDHWTLFGAGRLRDVAPGSNVFADTIPNYLSLLHWSRLRYAIALRRGDVLQASGEVRHLADLIRSQGILVAEFSAVLVYRLDASARDTAAERGLDVSAWPATDPEQLDRHRRMAFASLYFNYPGVRPDTVRKAVACMPAPCSALVEGAGANGAFGAFGATDNRALLKKLATENGCEAAAFEYFSHNQEIPAGDALAGLSNEIPRFFIPQH